MPKKYRLIFESPGGYVRAESDNLVTLKTLVSEQIEGMISHQKRIEAMSLHEAAKEAFRLYNNPHFKTRRRRATSTISKGNLGIDVSRCYLMNMTIAEIVQWIRKNKKVCLSKSAVGRFCTSLYRIGIAPTGMGSAEALKV